MPIATASPCLKRYRSSFSMACAERVPVVERLPQARLAQVGGDHAGLHRDRPLDELAGVRPVRRGRALRVRRDQAQDLAVRDEARLDHLGEAGHVVLRAAASPGSPGRRAPRRAGGTRRPGSCPPAMSIAVLPPTAASTMPSSVVGTQHDGHAAQPGRGGEPGEVGRRSAADADHAVGPGHLRLGQPGPEPGEDGDVLGRLAARHLGRRPPGTRRRRARGRPGAPPRRAARRG